MVNGETGCLKSEEELAEIFAKHSVDVNKQTVHSCNSGVTACIVQLGFNVCNEQAEKSAIYDGSFSEYVSITHNISNHNQLLSCLSRLNTRSLISASRTENHPRLDTINRVLLKYLI